MNKPDIESLVAEASRRYPTLFQLFGGYFHQDWTLDYSDPTTAIAGFKTEAEPQVCQAAIAELSDLLTLHLGEDDIERVLYPGLECNYLPMVDGIAMSEWLATVRDQLSTGMLHLSES